MRIAFPLGILVVSLTSASLASAHENDAHVPPAPTVAAAPRPAQEPSRWSRWYGWQTLTADGLALGIGVVGAGTESTTLGHVALGSYLVGAPIVHLAHDEPARAFGSLALRAGLPAAGLLAGCQLDDDPGFLGCIGGAALGTLIGMSAAIAIDSAALAWSDTPVKAADAAPKRFAISPTFTTGKGAYGLGLSATF